MAARELKGLTVIFTGNGKGKTSAAIGAVIRALGHGFKCEIIQFIKANKETGEILLLEKLGPQLEIVQFGLGFTWRKEHSTEEHRQAASEGLKKAAEDLRSGRYQMIVLDEILYAIRGGLVGVPEVVELIGFKQAATHLILTGRDAPRELIELADMVTSMEPVKHPLEKGIPAQMGLDF